MSPASPPSSGQSGEQRKVTFTFRGSGTRAEQPAFPPGARRSGEGGEGVSSLSPAQPFPQWPLPGGLSAPTLPPSPQPPNPSCHLLPRGPTCVWPSLLGLAKSSPGRLEQSGLRGIFFTDQRSPEV